MFGPRRAFAAADEADEADEADGSPERTLNAAIICGTSTRNAGCVSASLHDPPACLSAIVGISRRSDAAATDDAAFQAGAATTAAPIAWSAATLTSSRTAGFDATESHGTPAPRIARIRSTAVRAAESPFAARSFDAKCSISHVCLSSRRLCACISRLRCALAAARSPAPTRAETEDGREDVDAAPPLPTELTALRSERFAYRHIVAVARASLDPAPTPPLAPVSQP